MNKTTIGFLGDGQLAKMSAEAALELGFSVRFLGRNPQECCRDLGEFFNGDIFSREDVEKFAKDCDLVTLENEFIPVEVLIGCAEKLYPSLEAFKKIENKVVEKETAKSFGLPVGGYQVFKTLDEVSFESPSMLKLSKGGYDGYGNFLIKSREELEQLRRKNMAGPFIVEELIPFEREVAITLARSVSGQVVSYPVVDTIQKNHMCSRVIAPSTLSESVQNSIQKSAARFVEGLDYVGVMSLEFFVLKNGEIFFNESSPRPHNSGHYTMDACPSSQFENHIRAIAGMPLGETSMLFPHTVMLNILGKTDGPANPQGMDLFPRAKFHFYKKTKSRIGRKMGHVNLLGNERQELLNMSDELEKEVGV